MRAHPNCRYNISHAWFLNDPLRAAFIKIAILELNEDILDQETVEKMVPNCPEPTDIATVGTKPMHD